MQLDKSMTICHTFLMSTEKIAITIQHNDLARLDSLVASGLYPNRSKAIQDAITDKLSRLDKSRLAQACALLNPQEEQSLADEPMSGDVF